METEEGMIVIDTSMLPKDYLWHLEEHLYSKEGLAFEQGMIDRIRAEVEKLTTEFSGDKA